MNGLLSREHVVPESLDGLCDDALVLSKDRYSEFSLGEMVIRYASASWHTSTGGLAVLKNKSISYKGHELNKRPAALEVFEKPAERVLALTRFAFSTRDVNGLKVFKLIMPMHDALTHAEQHLNQKHINDLQKEWQQSHLTEPTQEDINMLFDELGRGASGLHTRDSEELADL